MLDAVPNAVGPGGWPRAMLIGLAVFSFLALVTEVLAWRQAVRGGGDIEPPRPKSENGSTALALIGVAIILVYGFSIPYLGFALATFLFLVVWCLLGKVRSPLTIGLVSVIGTVVLLYMFVALAKMPLNRGAGPINEWTVSLYRILRIY